MTLIRVTLASWSRFITRNFVVAPELFGLAHEFQFEEGRVRVELPTVDELSNDATAEDKRMHVHAYTVENGREIPTRILVDSVDVFVRLNKTLGVPEELLTRHPNQYEILSKEQQRDLDNLANIHEDVSERAFDLWIRTLRWKLSNGAIGRPEIHGYESGWSTYLFNDETQWRLWAGRQVLPFRLENPVTLAEWHRVQEALNLGQRPPVYIDLFFDGMNHLSHGELQRSVVDLAVACETFMRRRVMEKIPYGLTEGIRRYIDESNIRQVLDHFFPDTLTDDDRKLLKSINSRLHQLFDVRNRILHSGQKEDLTAAECNKYLEATEKLIGIG